MLLYVAAIHSPQQHERIAAKSVPTVITPAYFQAKVTRLYSILEVTEELQWRISGLGM